MEQYEVLNLQVTSLVLFNLLLQSDCYSTIDLENEKSNIHEESFQEGFLFDAQLPHSAWSHWA